MISKKATFGTAPIIRFIGSRWGKYSNRSGSRAIGPSTGGLERSQYRSDWSSAPRPRAVQIRSTRNRPVLPFGGIVCQRGIVFENNNTHQSQPISPWPINTSPYYATEHFFCPMAPVCVAPIKVQATDSNRHRSLHILAVLPVLPSSRLR